ncbi:MAG: Uma2 family endonuclease [Bryobacterales bacterium]|nr:Uma2 family endonuclease [Bryobacterales bacterium]
MSTTTLVSVEEYLRRTGKPNCEYIDGVLYPKPMATTLHALTQVTICPLMRSQGVYPLSELTLRVRSEKFLVPDVAVAREIELPYPARPVLLCIEILFPEDRLGSTFAKCEDYHNWGVPYCWVIDPEKRTAWEYHKGGEPVHIDRGGALNTGELVLRLNELFADFPSER